MTDERINEIANDFIEWTEQGYAVLDKVGFARALLAAADAQPVYQGRKKTDKIGQWTDITESHYQYYSQYPDELEVRVVYVAKERA